MLKSLFIKNYALIENIEVEFENGLNIITGETGAGKSIIIGAMNLLLGERASSDIVRKGAKKAIVEGIFDVTNNKKIEKLFEKFDLDFEPELILRREVSLKSTSRSFINDTPVQLSIIKEIGRLLVDLHGQHDHQTLLRTDFQLAMLDEFGNYEKLIEKYHSQRKRFLAKVGELKELKNKEQSLIEKKEFYSFQLEEIDKISPGENEDSELEEELNILENSEKLLNHTTQIYHQLYEAENSVFDSLVSVQHLLNELLGIDKSFTGRSQQLDEILASVNDLADYFRDYKDKLDVEPERINFIRERLGELNLLKKKYGKTIDKILEYRKVIEQELNLAENFTDKIASLETEIESLRRDLSGIATGISEKRKKIAEKLKKGVESELKNLGINDANFSVKFKTTEVTGNEENYVLVNDRKIKFGTTGIDEIEFYISTNIGEEPKPLAKVASGGEISRIMLALKSILAKNDKLPLLIFDEIDTGISGRIAQKVGRAMKNLASFHQIISITHLPQIAGLADCHFVVEKIKKDGRVISRLRRLSDDERVKEVAKLISGEEVTESSLKGARELMNI